MRNISWTKNEDDNPSTINVDSEGNHVFFYSEINDISILLLHKKLRKVEHDILMNKIKFNSPKLEIYLHIKSSGGLLLSGFTGMDIISQISSKIVTIVEGCAASAATLLSLSGNHRCITKNSYMLIHQLRSGTWGKYEDMKDDMENFNMFMENLIGFYREKTKIKEKEIKKILQKDIWFDAKKCLELGLVDEII